MQESISLFSKRALSILDYSDIFFENSSLMGMNLHLCNF